MFGRPSRLSGSGREALSDVWELSGIPYGLQGVVERLSRMSGSGREALLDVRQLQGGPPVCPGVVGSPFRKLGRTS